MLHLHSRTSTLNAVRMHGRSRFVARLKRQFLMLALAREMWPGMAEIANVRTKVWI